MSRCAECRLPIYFRGKRDAVGRWTSEGEWTHWDKDANGDHAAIGHHAAREQMTNLLLRAVDLEIIDSDQASALMMMWAETHAPLEFGAAVLFEDDDG